MAESLPLQAITFDLDDTLWDNHGVMVATETGHYAWLDRELSGWLQARGRPAAPRFSERFPLESFEQHRRVLARTHPLHRGDFTWLRERALTEMLGEYGLDPASARLWAGAAMERFMELRHQVTPYPEVEPLLTELGRHYRLASITNGNVAVQRLALGRHFPVAIAAGEMLAPKPDPRPFLAALARLGASPARTLHVGDSWREDVEPARRLGMRVAWISPHVDDSPMPPGIHRLDHVRELPALLRQLGLARHH
ncbi:HAD family hydrolase [Billgrantia tianxiuensis]|jgi:HAD superfamily hydrolase (TIGR01509 family)|uniref:HAD family hydrolase n=1 Tax=Billgrantia tianxiuensis TaxID=2497861 RepID=A0A6I6SVF4_9GAMM|nr:MULTISPECIES: HAD family hydrolase [Halomonas]MCE8035414.1 HAD family hydrolase [Halomonas sp. MCCC 1A11057]QHC51800.1 HAD family hydrolase [Halomonas tianxiuensis]